MEKVNSLKDIWKLWGDVVEIKVGYPIKFDDDNTGNSIIRVTHLQNTDFSFEDVRKTNSNEQTH